MFCFYVFWEVVTRIGLYLSDFIEKVKYLVIGWFYLDSCRFVVDIVWLFYVFIKIYVWCYEISLVFIKKKGLM